MSKQKPKRTTLVERTPQAAFGYPYVFAFSVIEGFDATAHHRLVAEETVIGRDEGADFRLDDPGVSGEHARIFVRGGVVEIMDLNSRNGVLLNGRKIVPKVRQRVKHLDELKIGRTRLLFTANRFVAAPDAAGE